jgi:hypothetical protein
VTSEDSARSLIDLPLTGGPIAIAGALEPERTAHGLLPHWRARHVPSTC